MTTNYDTLRSQLETVVNWNKEKGKISHSEATEMLNVINDGIEALEELSEDQSYDEVAESRSEALIELEQMVEEGL